MDDNKVLYEFNSDDPNGSFCVEVEEVNKPSNDYYDEDATRGDNEKDAEQRKKMSVTFEKALSPLKSAWNSVATLMEDMSPDETSIEMGVKIGGKAGIPFAILASKDYHLKVTMKWKKAEKVEEA